MIRRYKNTRQALFHMALGRMRGDSGNAIGVIGGADGPTAVFVARKPRRRSGVLVFRPDFAALRRAAAASFAFAALVATLAALLYSKNGRKR